MKPFWNNCDICGSNCGDVGEPCWLAKMKRDLEKNNLECPNCDHHGFPCLNCSEYVFEGGFGPGYADGDRYLLMRTPENIQREMVKYAEQNDLVYIMETETRTIREELQNEAEWMRRRSFINITKTEHRTTGECQYDHVKERTKDEDGYDSMCRNREWDTLKVFTKEELYWLERDEADWDAMDEAERYTDY